MSCEHFIAYLEANPGKTATDYVIRYPYNINLTGLHVIEWKKIPYDILYSIYKITSIEDCLEICRVRPEFLTIIRDIPYNINWLKFLVANHKNMILFYMQRVIWDESSFIMKEFFQLHLKDHPKYEKIRAAYYSTSKKIKDVRLYIYNGFIKDNVLNQEFHDDYYEYFQ